MLHPVGTVAAGTSLDNQIVTYAARDRFRQNRKKTFKVCLPSPALLPSLFQLVLFLPSAAEMAGVAQAPSSAACEPSAGCA